MRRLKIFRDKNGCETKRPFGLEICQVKLRTIETGEVIKRGCGLRGLAPWDGGMRCLYCGNWIYQPEVELETLWFHFKTGRDYWRSATIGGRDYINGVPAQGQAEDLPSLLLPDLKEVRPPSWFAWYLLLDEKQFKKYLETRETAHDPF